MTSGGDKAQARKRGFARRKAAHGSVDPAPAQTALAGLLAMHPDAVVSGYMPIRSEIDPLPAMARRAGQGAVCVPVIDGPDLPLRFRAWTPTAMMVAGPFGALVPHAGAFVVPSLLIVPLVAFDAAGYRLGYGGGFYDRTLAGLRAAGDVLAVGFAYAAQEEASLPVEQTDQPLDGIVTERGVRWFVQPRSPKR